MSKRKNRNQSPNIPQSTLDRARQQLGQAADEEAVEAVPEVKAAPARVIEKAEPVVAARPAVERRPRPARTSTTTSRSTSRKEDKHDMNYIRQRLANPTRIVTEADLKAEYSYVMTDLRTMGILATILVIALVVIEKII
ncbi:MAG: hypothetical protein ABI970_11180 [Chloroflexota bacterium]|nr:hypothetical protein [Anaerolineae bacterium]